MKTVEIKKVGEIQKIMGNNFFGPDDYLKYYKDDLGKFQIPEIPIEPGMLTVPCPFYSHEKVADTHSLILLVPELNDKPLTMMELQKLHPAHKQPRFWGYGIWYKDQKFTNTPPCEKPVWVLMLNEMIPNSEGTTRQAQQSLLPKGYFVPSAIQEILKLFFHYLTTGGEYLNKYKCARVKDIASDGYYVFLGRFTESGLFVHNFWLDFKYSDAGFAALRDLN